MTERKSWSLGQNPAFIRRSETREERTSRLELALRLLKTPIMDETFDDPHMLEARMQAPSFLKEKGDHRLPKY